MNYRKPTPTQLIEAMAKHLPPSAANLRLLDVGAVCAEILLQLRPDLQPQTVSYNAEDWTQKSASADAIVAYDRYLDAFFLERSLDVLRPGGRLIVVHPEYMALSVIGERLEHYGYVRLLVEHAVSEYGTLIRGERIHTTDDTLARVQSQTDHALQGSDLSTYNGRYLHLLVQQSPDKPVWKLNPEDRVVWQAVTIEHDSPTVLAFSSLPKAVSFMQEAVLANRIQDVNKIPKFKIATMQEQDYEILLNPTLAMIAGYDIGSIDVPPTLAEASDE